MYNHFVTAFYIFGFLKRNRGRSIEISPNCNNKLNTRRTFMQ